MTAADEFHETLTRTGPDTPMGDLFRRFWLPALLSRELPEPDGTPVRLRILGEDLVAFRNTEGRVGIIDAYCPHRGAQLFFGRNEECGLRCVYHGWKFDVDGNCLDVPNIVPPENYEKIKARLKIVGYPTLEAGGLVWVYMGPPEHMPESLPDLPFLKQPPESIEAFRWIQRTNWAQGLEGDIDSSHINFLHARPSLTQATGTNKVAGGANPFSEDSAPENLIHENDGGFVYGARRRFQGQYYWRVTHWLLPTWTMPSASAVPTTGTPERDTHFWLPIDDEHTMTFSIRACVDGAYSAEDRAGMAVGIGFAPRLERASIVLPDGYIIDTWEPVANRSNDYLIDRELQRSKQSYSGIFGINDEDRGIQEAMRPVRGRRSTIDRAHENLVRADAAVVAARHRIVKFARDLAQGLEPPAARRPSIYNVGGKTLLSANDDFETLLKDNPDILRTEVNEQERHTSPELA